MKILKISIILLMLGSVIFLIYRASVSSSKDISETTNAKYRSIRKVMTISGVAQPTEEFEIKSTISGIMKEVYVHIGDEVTFGEAIARIQLAKDPVEYKSLLKELDVAKTKLDDSKSKFERTKLLYNEKLIATEEYETMKSNLSILQTEYNSIVSELNMVHGEYKLKGISNIITATNKGTIIELPIREGGSVMARGSFSEGTTVARIADLRSLVFKGSVLESDILKLKIGAPIIFSLGTTKYIKLTGKLIMIAPKGILENGVSRFEVVASMNIPDFYRQYIKAGGTVNAEIVLESKKHVLALEEKYFQFNYDSIFVEVQASKKRYNKRYLKIGISDGIYAEILSGIDSLDKIKVTN